MRKQLHARRSIRSAFLLGGVVLSAISVAADASEAPLNEQIDSFVIELKESFEKELSNPVVKSTRLSRTDRYFVSVLKRNQPFYALIRTNSRGVIINEVIRGETPERNLRNISNQRWFSQIERTHEPYYGFLKQDNGRYYLFWSMPLLSKSRSGSSRFVGAVAAKIDLWDTFHKFSEQTTLPFLIKIGGMSLYSHKWDDSQESVEKELSVPGVDRIAVRYVEQTFEPAQPETAEVAAAPTQPQGNGSATPPEAAAIKKVNPKILIGLGVVLFLILAIASVRLLLWARHRALMRKIEREDLL